MNKDKLLRRDLDESGVRKSFEEVSRALGAAADGLSVETTPADGLQALGRVSAALHQASDEYDGLPRGLCHWAIRPAFLRGPHAQNISMLLRTTLEPGMTEERYKAEQEASERPEIDVAAYNSMLEELLQHASLIVQRESQS